MVSKLREYLERHIEINEEFWQEVIEHTKEIFIRKNDILVNHGSRRRCAYVITSGSLQASLIATNSEQNTVCFYMEDLFHVAVCMDSYFLGEPTNYEVTALEDSKVYRFNKETVDSWILKYPSFNEFFRADIIESFIQVNEIRNHMITHPPSELISYLYRNYPLIFDKIPDKHIAQFMGITPEWFSKLKKKKKHLIE